MMRSTSPLRTTISLEALVLFRQQKTPKDRCSQRFVYDREKIARVE